MSTKSRRQNVQHQTDCRDALTFQGFHKPVRDLLRKINHFTILRLQQNRWRATPRAVVVNMDKIHLFDRARKIPDTRFVDCPQNRLRCAVTICVSSHFYSREVHRKILKRHISHLRRESGVAGKRHLIEGDVTSEGRLERATLAALDVIQNE